jgi:FkbM family methyltransferase
MDTTEAEPDTQSLLPYGRYAPAGRIAWILRFTRGLPPSRLARKLAFAVRDRVLASLEEPVDCQVFGLPTRLHPRDNASEKKVLFTPWLFDVAELDYLERVAAPGFRFVDIGANAGFYSLFLASRIPQGARLIAVEPDPEMYRRLTQNIALSRAPIVPCPYAVADRPGFMQLRISRVDRGGNRLVDGTPVSDGSETITVETVPLLDLLDRYEIDTPDAVKLDIEGAEYKVLKAFFDVAPAARHPRSVLLEKFHIEPHADPIGLLRNHGYREVVTTKLNCVLEKG